MKFLTQAEVRINFIRYNPGVRRPHKKGYWYKCAHCRKWCGRPGYDDVEIPIDMKMEVDHIRPWSKGGSDALYNLQPLCRICNRSKSANIPLKDQLKLIKNDILHADFIKSEFRKVFRQNKTLKYFGFVNRY